MNDSERFCPLCLGHGVVGVYEDSTVQAVREGRRLTVAHRTAVACCCEAGQERFRPEVCGEDGDGRKARCEFNRFTPGVHCPLPYLFHMPKTFTVSADASIIARWLNTEAAVGGGT